MLKWEDEIYVFEQMHIERSRAYTGDTYLHKIANLEIEDNYQYFQSELVLLLLERLPFEHTPPVWPNL